MIPQLVFLAAKNNCCMKLNLDGSDMTIVVDLVMKSEQVRFC